MELSDKGLSDVRSEEVQEIISKVPGWLVQWGISLIFSLFLILLSISWFIRYPDVITAKVVVTTDPAPINLVTRLAGKILLGKKDNEHVAKGELIALIQTNTDPEVVLRIEHNLLLYQGDHSYSTLFDALSKEDAGDLQTYLSSALKAIQEINSFEETKLQEKQILYLRRQASSYYRLNTNLLRQLGLMKQETTLSYEQFKVDSLLLNQKVLAPLDFNKAKGNYLQQQRSLNSTEASILSNQLLASGLEKQIVELEIDRKTRKAQLLTAANNSVKELNSRVKNWKETYLFLAPIEGTLCYLGFIENEQYVENDKSIFAMIPVSNSLIAKAELPLTGAGKVKAGQDVNISLRNYPYEQFGMLRGHVKTISLVPEKDSYTVTISLSEGMTSTYNRQLVFRPQLQGETNIITEDLGLLERVFYQLRKLFQSH